MKHLVTLGALALTLPAIALAHSPEDDRLEGDRQQTQQTRMHQQDAEQQTGQLASENRLTHLAQDHIKLDDLKDTTIVNREDEEIGTVSDVIVDQQGQVAAVVASAGGVMGLGSKNKALSWDDIQVRVKNDDDDDDEYEVVVDLSKQEFENLPEFEAERRSTSRAF